MNQKELEEVISGLLKEKMLPLRDEIQAIEKKISAQRKINIQKNAAKAALRLLNVPFIAEDSSYGSSSILISTYAPYNITHDLTTLQSWVFNARWKSAVEVIRAEAEKLEQSLKQMAQKIKDEVVATINIPDPPEDDSPT